MSYHVLNRGNALSDVFHKDGNSAAFSQGMVDAYERPPLRILSYVPMRNHVHLVPLPRHCLAWVNKPQTEAEVASMQRSIARGTPYGTEQRAAGSYLKRTTSWSSDWGPPQPTKVECPLFHSPTV